MTSINRRLVDLCDHIQQFVKHDSHFTSAFFFLLLLSYSAHANFSTHPIAPGNSQYQPIAIGSGHICALSTDDDVYCWGSNISGQSSASDLANPVTKPTVVSKSTGMTGVVALTAGLEHTCALTNVGKVYCWGLNNNGQLGIGSTTNYQTIPQLVSGIALVRAIKAGGTTTCAITAMGIMKCWGYDGSQQLGNGRGVNNEYSPTSVSVLNDVITMDVGAQHVCAITVRGQLYCWGSDDHGELGDNSDHIVRSVPALVQSNDRFKMVAAGNHHTCALNTVGEVKCWGNNNLGQLGNGQSTGSLSVPPLQPINFNSTSPITSISTSSTATCARHANGEIKCWGSNNHGIFGNPYLAIGSYATPQAAMLTSAPILDIAVGINNACVALLNGDLFCTGAHGQYQTIGTEDPTIPLEYTTPTAPLDLSPVLPSVGFVAAAGDHHSCTTVLGGDVECWGRNTYAQVGTGSISPPVLQATALGTSDIISVSVGNLHTCALTIVGTVRCWGNNRSGQSSGDGTQSASVLTPQTIPGLENVIAITSGSIHNCALLANGKMKCWGGNGSGQNGVLNFVFNPINNIISWTSPNIVLYPSFVFTIGSNTTNSAVTISARELTSCATLASGAVNCWGFDSGIFNPPGNKKLPHQIQYMDGGTELIAPIGSELNLGRAAFQVSVGGKHICMLVPGILPSGKAYIKCAGQNDKGQLGTGNFYGPWYIPQYVLSYAGLYAPVTITTGYDHNLATQWSDFYGRFFSWGGDERGQLGNGLPFKNTNVPEAQFQSFSTHTISAGSLYSILLADDYSGRSFGYNDYGQLGVGSLGGMYPYLQNILSLP